MLRMGIGNQMTIVLVNSRTTRFNARENFLREPPSGLLILAAVLENAGYSVEIVDLEIAPDYKAVLRYEPQDIQFLGLTFLTPTFPLAIDIAHYIAELSPGIHFITGGPHASFMPTECFQEMPNLTAVVLGEGETQVVELARLFAASNSGSPTKDLAGIPGIAYKNSQGQIVQTAYPPPVDVNALPMPARHLLTSDYNVATVIVNRGCPNQCSFCTRQALFRSVRVRSVASVMAELLQIQGLPNYQYVNFYDNVNVDPKFMSQLCQGMQKIKFFLPWGAELRIDRLTPALANQMKDARCAGVATGIETANEQLLRANGKVQRISEVRQGLQAAIDADLTVQAYFVLGLPGETQETFQETLAFIESSPLRPGQDIVNFFPATPYPGSHLWTHREELKWSLMDSNYANWDCYHLIMNPSTLTSAELSQMTAEAGRVTRKYHGQDYAQGGTAGGLS